MLGRPRFWLYRTVVGLATWIGFRTQRVIPLGPPRPGPVEHRPYAEAHPGLPIRGLHEATTFTGADKRRVRRIELTARALRLVGRLAPRTTPPVPDDERRYFKVAYPWLFRRAWPHAPSTPPELVDRDADVVAALAVRGPFASYLRRSDDGDYTIDLRWITAHPTHASLERPGGVATFELRDGELATRHIDTSRERFLAALNEDLTTFRHNISVHLATLTPFAIASTNHLDPDHPIRRLLHHCFHTVLVGNREVGTMQLSGRRGFSVSIFSHDERTLTAMAEEHLGHFDLFDFEPPSQFVNRGTSETPFAYPYRDNVMRLWDVTTSYVGEYLDLYYRDDAAVAKDSQLTSWAAELDRLVPNGVSIPIGGIDRAWLARTCATLIHVSTVEHDVLNNVVWHYSTLGWLIPTVVPMDQRRAFDLVATIIGTWKPYNMLLTASIPTLALDDAAAAVMQRYLDRLADVEADLPADPSVARPTNFNVSISN